MQEFDLEIKDKKGVENLKADHLSCLENLSLEPLEEAIMNGTFLDEQLLFYDTIIDDSSSFVDIANYLVSNVVPTSISQ